MGKDWKQWHQHYEQADLLLGERLEAVRHELRQALTEAGTDLTGAVQLTAMCAGEGRDVLPVLAAAPSHRRIFATLIELDPVLADRARSMAEELELSDVRVLTADAGVPETYRHVPCANVLTVCGVFGNMTEEHVNRTIAALPGLLAPDGLVIWTRGVQDRDRTPDIRSQFALNGFTEVSFISTAHGAFRIGVHRLTREPSAAALTNAGNRIFAFS